MPSIVTPDAGISPEASKEAPPISQVVRISVGSVALEGDLEAPSDPSGLTCEKELKVIPGASHLFEEPGALEQVARRAAAWFGRTLAKDAST